MLDEGKVWAQCQPNRVPVFQEEISESLSDHLTEDTRTQTRMNQCVLGIEGRAGIRIGHDKDGHHLDQDRLAIHTSHPLIKPHVRTLRMELGSH